MHYLLLSNLFRTEFWAVMQAKTPPEMQVGKLIANAGVARNYVN